MRNKGAIWTLAIALALVCIYQLSFTWKAVSVRNQAVEYALDKTTNEVDPVTEQYFLDSVANEKIYFFNMFSYRDCIERELNFGLDLKGGMNIILEISVNDVIRNLSSSPQDTTLNKALVLAKEYQRNSGEDFVMLFGKAFEEVAPGASLKSLFLTKELSDKISFNATNEEVISVLAVETKGAIDNAFNIIRTRIDQFGVAQPNIQRMETAGRILVDLPGVKDRDRVRKLLQGTANLEFWEVYENTADVQQVLLAINEVVKNQKEAEKALEEATSEGVEQITEPETTEEVAEEGPGSLLEEVAGDTSKAELTQDVDAQYPFFSIMQPFPIRDNTSAGPVIGVSHFKDTAKVNLYLKLAKEKNIIPRDMRYMWSAKAITGDDDKPTNNFELYAIKVTGRDGKAPLDGDVITSARQEFDDARGSAHVSMTMNGDGATKWARLTRENVGQAIAIVMDNKVFSAPIVQGEIKGGSSQITGNFTIAEADDLANLLKSGKLPAPARIIQETVVGPSLGHESVNSGLNSFIIAFAVILLYMMFYYSRNAGFVADIALVVNLFFIIGVLASLGAALTLPGIAGIVLTIGMSVDANVLIFERIREELAAGKGLKLAVKDGFRNAYSAIIDANVTTLITGIILLMFGTGPIKGFATTLVIGIFSSLFTAIFVSRIIIEQYLSKNVDFKFATKLTQGAFKNVNIKFLEKRKLFYVVSILLVGISLASILGFRGLDFGVDFKGGRNFIVRFDAPVDNKDVATSIGEKFGEEPSVITFGEEDQVRITTLYRIDEEGTDIEDQIQQELYTALKPYFAEDLNYTDFAQTKLLSSQKVGATIADDIQRNSVWVLLSAIGFMFIYIFLRFRNWQYGLGAVVALIHDSIIVLGLFSILHGIMPFSLEIDQAFIAAILTVIGYSINDTVVVYDRIREYVTIHPKHDRKDVINNALNSTLSRTINTSLTTIVVLSVIFILGGEAIQGFTFALLAGIIVGTYSSLFIATPLVYDTVIKSVEKAASKKKQK
ncbi:MAG: protein translocase subunit SecDF [Bacteroidales bacterium]|nr:protein translocase subunit SecDF [Bacteroidales bacterium]MBN2817487.1 protein translocase subunit SecDF [Bacteroidales bacterium]